MPDPFSNVPPPDTQKRRTLCESLLVPTFHTWNSTSDLCQQEMDERRDPRRLCVGSPCLTRGSFVAGQLLFEWSDGPC